MSPPQERYIVGNGNGGNINIRARTLSLTHGARLDTTTFVQGKAGNIQVDAADSVELIGTAPNGRFSSGLFTITRETGAAGDLTVNTTNLNLTNEAEVSAQSLGTGRAGNITINADGDLHANNGQIIAAAVQAGGGDINITAEDILLRDNSDIRTNISSGEGSGGNINLTAKNIIAFDDSDILAFAAEGRGGNITLNTPAFFDFRYQPALSGTNSDNLDGNNQVDINASGAFAGVITLPDVSFLQNGLTQLPEILIDTNNLVANSCITRSGEQRGNFNITGAGGLPTRPGDAAISPYPTGTVRSVPNNDALPSSSQTIPVPSIKKAHPWKMGDPIVEPQGVYRLANGELVLSRECSH